MDAFSNSNPFHSTVWSHNDTSDKIYSEAPLDPATILPDAEDAFLSSSLLLTNQGIDVNSGSTVVFPSTNPVQPASTCQFSALPLPNLQAAQLFLSNPPIWAPSFTNSHVSSFKDQGQFDNQAPNSFGNIQQPASFNGLNGLNISSLPSGSPFSFTKTLPLHQQANTQLSADCHELNHVPSCQGHMNQLTATTNTGFDGTFKPRVRARRGQATDPHSIAERQRREKISERMKNLQELVPNSNKTDKASMLDEIIDYVKFLQLQVKVLSMSRLGATEAVVPLLTESQSEVSSGALSSVSVESTANVSLDRTAEQQDSVAFEREVVQLMESNMTSAMQYLQNKGLCLMPIALASAISIQKGIHKVTIPPEKQNSDPELRVVSSFCNDAKEN